jgi:hypothetical protein
MTTTELPGPDGLLLRVERTTKGPYLIIYPAKRPPYTCSELDEQQEVVYLLRKQGELVLATMNEGDRDKAAAARAKRAGMHKGASDLVWTRAGGQTVYIEMKRASGQLSDIDPQQAAFLADVVRRGHLGVVCFGYKAARYLVHNIEAFTEYLGAIDAV